MPLGVYVHIPFCLKKCDYCDFFSIPVVRGALPHEAYLAAIAAQLDRELSRGDASPLAGRRVSSIYFGGGTPSLMPPEFFESALSLLRRRFDVSADAEVSCEVNPATADAAWFRAAKGAGITRISIGVQSFQPRLLTALGRIHSAEEAMRSIAEAQEAGFEGVGIDLMYAITGETMAMLEDDLRTAMTFQPEHVSAYELTIEEREPPLTFILSPACPPKLLWREGRGNSAPSPPRGEGQGEGGDLESEEVELAQMRTAARMLKRGGWHRYEISNYARPGHECRHNLNYWRYGEWLGLGAGATSFVRWHSGTLVRSSTAALLDGVNQRTSVPAYQRTVFGRRWTQPRDVAAYLAGSGALAEDEAIDLPTAMGEFCFLGLRTMEGISRRIFGETFGVAFDAPHAETVAALVKDGLLDDDGDRICLTSKGFELANQAFSKFLR